MESYCFESEAQGRITQITSADSTRDKVARFKRIVGHNYINTLTETDEDYHSSALS